MTTPCGDGSVLGLAMELQIAHSQAFIQSTASVKPHPVSVSPLASHRSLVQMQIVHYPMHAPGVNSPLTQPFTVSLVVLLD